MHTASQYTQSNLSMIELFLKPFFAISFDPHDTVAIIDRYPLVTLVISHGHRTSPLKSLVNHCTQKALGVLRIAEGVTQPKIRKGQIETPGNIMPSSGLPLGLPWETPNGNIMPTKYHGITISILISVLPCPK